MSGSLSQLYLSDPNLAVALRRQQQAQGLVNQSLDASPTTWAGALARLVQAYAGNRNLGRADDQIKGIADQRDQEFRTFNSDLPQVASTPPASVPAPVVGAAPAAPGAVARDPSIPTIGQQANNPGNLSYNVPGSTGYITAADGQKVGVFPDVRTGVAAHAYQLGRYAQQGIRTVQDAVNNWVLGTTTPDAAGAARTAPYANAIAAKLGVKPGDPIDLTDPAVQSAFIVAQQPYESGRPWLNPADVEAGVAMARDPSFGRGAAPQAGGARSIAGGAAPPPPGAPAADAGGPPGAAPPVAPPSGAGPDAPSGPPRASPLADVYLQQAMALQRKAQQAAASNNPRIQALAPDFRMQAQFYAGLAKEKPKTNVLRPGGMLVDDQGRVIARAPDDTGPLTPVWDGKERDEKGMPVYRLATRPQGVGQIAPPPGPLLSSNVNIGAELAESAKRGTDLASEGTAVRNAARASAVTLDNIRTLESIEAETGRLAPAQEVIGGWLDALGIKSDAVRKAKTLQEFNGLVAPLILGEQTKQAGVQTEGDAKRIGQMLGSITNTTEANKFLARAVEAQARRQLDQSKFYDEWYAKNKTYGGAQQAWNQFILDAPLTTKDGDEVVFYNEFANHLLQKGITPERILSAWKSKAQRK